MAGSLADRSAQPVDRLLGGYLILTAAALLFPHRGAGWPLLFLFHAALSALLLTGVPQRLRSISIEGRPIARALADWYPLLLMPFLYWELPQLSGAIWDGHFFDPVVMRWEEAVFGHQPSATLANARGSRIISEILHGAYLSYYPIIYFLPAGLYLRRQREAFHDTVFALMLGFTVCYLFFTAFPVQGPRYLFPPPGGAPADAVLYGVTHSVLESGSSQGAAFPSSHAAIAAIQTISALRHLPAAAPVLGLLTVGICVGAVYGGFHYAVDMAAGVTLGLLVAWVSPTVRRALR